MTTNEVWFNKSSRINSLQNTYSIIEVRIRWEMKFQNKSLKKTQKKIRQYVCFFINRVV